MAGGGEYEPKDSRNVTGTASTPDGRWTKNSKHSANGKDAADNPDDAGDETAEPVVFEPDRALLNRIEKGEEDRRKSRNNDETEH